MDNRTPPTLLGGPIYQYDQWRLQQAMKDDFMVGGVSTGLIGELGWFFGESTGKVLASQSVEYTNGASLGSGLQVNSGTGMVPHIHLTLRPSVTGTAGNGQVIGTSNFDLVMAIRTLQMDASINYYMGLSDNPYDPNTEANLLRFEGIGTNGWDAVVKSPAGGTQSQNFTGSRTTSNTARLRIRRIPGSGIGFSINEANEVVFTNNLPLNTAPLYVHMSMRSSANNANKQFACSHFHMLIGIPGAYLTR